MDIFEEMMAKNHEQVVFGYDKEAKLKAIIAIHNTTLGPALGGTRMWPYKSEAEALRDVLRLSRGMTFKSAIAGINMGGGKAVIIGDPATDKNEILFRAFGRFVQSLHGRFVTGEDVGVSVQDVEWMRSETQYVVGISESLGGSGDPSPVTARGVYHGMKACIEEVYNTSSLNGMRVAIQGLGQVGKYLADLLYADGAQLIVTDLREERVQQAAEKYNAKVVAPDDIYSVDAEIFAPCALGSIVNDETIPQFKCKIIAGAANNQLDDSSKHNIALKKRGILYAPDYVINAGGLINVANEIEGYNRERAMTQVQGIYDILKRILHIAKMEDIPTNEASNHIALQRIESIARLGRKFVNKPAACYQRGRVFH